MHEHADILAPIRGEPASASHGKASTSELDEVHRLKQEISKQVKTLVKELLKDASPRVEELVRTQLTDEFRFWR